MLLLGFNNTDQVSLTNISPPGQHVMVSKISEVHIFHDSSSIICNSERNYVGNPTSRGETGHTVH